MCDDVHLCNRCVREFMILARTWFAFGLPSKTGCDTSMSIYVGTMRGKRWWENLLVDFFLLTVVIDVQQLVWTCEGVSFLRTRPMSQLHHTILFLLLGLSPPGVRHHWSLQTSKRWGRFSISGHRQFHQVD
jgi:hypothetical protein